MQYCDEINLPVARPALQVMRENRLQAEGSIVLQINLPVGRPALQVMREKRLQVEGSIVL